MPDAKVALSLVFVFTFQWDEFVEQRLMNDMDHALEIIRAIRNLKKEYNVPRNHRSEVVISCSNMCHEMSYLSSLLGIIQNLAITGDIHLHGDNTSFDKDMKKYAMTLVGKSFEVFVGFGDAIDIDTELRRISQNIDKVNSQLDKFFSSKRKKLEFLSEVEELKVRELRNNLTKLEEQIRFLENCR